MRGRKLAYDFDGHSGSVEEDCDWGGPCEYQPACSCGWAGSTLGDVLHTDGNGIIGTRYEAFVELLDHMGLTVLDYIAQQEELMDKALDNIQQVAGLIQDQRLLNQTMRELA